MKLYIKYMMSNRYKIMVKEELINLGLNYVFVDLGMVEILEEIIKEQRENLKKNEFFKALSGALFIYITGVDGIEEWSRSVFEELAETEPGC